MVSKCREIMKRTAKMGTAAILAALVLLVLAVPAWADGKKLIENSYSDVEWIGGTYIDNENGIAPEINGKVTVTADTTYEGCSGMVVTQYIEVKNGVTLTITGQADSNLPILATICGDGTVVFAGGKVTVNGHNGDDGDEEDGDGKNGNSGVECTLIIKDGDVTIKGGNGGNGSNGSSNGISDGDDGGDGGNGGCGVNGCVTVEGGTLTVYGGNGGSGGNGGDGGTGDNGGDGGFGGSGGDGGDGIYDTVFVKGGILTVHGGNGGNGGKGGKGGEDGDDGYPGSRGSAGYGVTDDVSLEGGTLTVKGGKGTLVNEEAYDGNVEVATGFLYSDGTNHALTGDLETSELGGKTLKPVPAAEIGTTSFATVQATFDAVKAGDTVKLLRM